MTKYQILRTLLPLLFFVQSICYGQAGNVHWIGGKKFTSYKVQPKDTWTSLASRYSVSMQELQKANDGVKDLKIGQTIYVPAEKGNSSSTTTSKPVEPATTKPVEATQGSNGNVYHTVQKGETLYRISKMYNQSIADIKKWNNLSSDNVPLGKSLIVGKGSAAKIEKPASNSVVTTPDNTSPVKEEKPVVKEEKLVVKEEKPVTPEKHTEKPAATTTPAVIDTASEGTVQRITETGVATWLNDQELNQNKFYALHRTAPIGTIVKVTNRMTNNSVFVKVVGVLPDTGDNANIIIKITQAAAQRIGAIDQKFTAELSYGITH